MQPYKAVRCRLSGILFHRRGAVTPKIEFILGFMLFQFCSKLLSVNIYLTSCTLHVYQQHITKPIDTSQLSLHDDVFVVLASPLPPMPTIPDLEWDDQRDTMTSILDLLTRIMPKVKSCCCDDITPGNGTIIGKIIRLNTQLSSSRLLI